MKRNELLTVADSFQLSHIGLTLLPDFSVPSGWQNREERILIVTVSSEFEVLAQFNMTHFNILNPEVAADRRWRILASLPGVQKAQVPIGSRLFVSQELHSLLRGAASAQLAVQPDVPAFGRPAG